MVLMSAASLCCALFLFQSPSVAERRGQNNSHGKWVKNKRHLIEHVRAHRWRIVYLAEEIIHVGGARYKSVDRNLLKRAIFEHDEMKITTDRKLLRTLGFKRMVASHLVDLWGVSLSNEDGLNDSYGANILKLMNKGDQRLEQKHPPLVLEIVHLADKIDKGSDPITKHEELGRATIVASEYLSNPLNKEYNPTLAGFARVIESRYEQIIPNWMSSTGFRKSIEK